MAPADPLGLYLHIPFCAAICYYCNFNRGLFDEDLKRRYVRALNLEIDRAGDGTSVDSIYFGGGTPSLLEPDEVAHLLDCCRRRFGVTSDAEVTLELNPETATVERMDGLRRAGVNRLSIGVQSFRDEELRRLGRLHSAERAREAVRLARAAGFDNLSIDLMLWLPEQTLADWLASIEEVPILGPDHVSLYLLELYPNAPLREEMARHTWSLAPDEDAAAMYLEALDRLEAAGYVQYELSNVARPGKRCRHNVKYWSDGEWLGFGCGAHSTRHGCRWSNVADTGLYVERLEAGERAIVDHRTLSPGERFGDAVFTGLRLTAGIDLAAIFERYGVEVAAEYGPAIEPYREAGLVVYQGDRLRLTRQGMLLANEVMAVFV